MQARVDAEYLGPVGGCWRFGDRTVRACPLRFTAHPESRMCFSWARALSNRKHEIEHTSRHSPCGSWWRRVQHFAAFNRC
jgi:hypothetical protein